MVNIFDVAKLANVSIATVSRVTSNKEGVNEATKAAVLKAMEELGYRPNSAARTLRMSKSNIIIVLMLNIKNSFYSEYIRGLEEVAQKAGYFLLIGSTDGDMTKEKKYMNLIHDSRVDGVILTTEGIMNESSIKKINKSSPVVLTFDYVPGQNIPSISIDNESASRKITNHLINLGHKRIAHITGYMGRLQSQTRLNGYKQALLQHNITVEEALIQEGGYLFKDGYAAAQKLLSFDKLPSAIYGGNDNIAIGALKAVQEAGLRVPEDIAIVGFDNLDIANYMTPGLTTIHQPRYEIGKRAMSLLLLKIENAEIEKPHIILEDQLIIRDSCGYNLKEK
ncbi:MULTISPECIES: LacI family DNA-binding transcriptional regulator [unclassified Sporosarcina]|uniref:LacI family DNA-binding transcriptional regulator n=1 Tax=unclassified Sporosarcina TaxID=2647733 RepID=UPI00203F5553|nr:MULTISPECIES: LacI family DNA-binding transcriptional regulator [unclassified Sporosarcina]GKV66942.1 LacI family transcriptional regulator [Sporosarcina sp. NCCP-2331]GLB57301.1 LacI family transcriptional regulator [Sporosarcina sp. NCCP-2378]